MKIRHCALLVCAVLSSFWPAASLQAAAPVCEFRLGFKALHDLMPDRVGSCLDDEFYNLVGDSNQHTSGGLLAWRKLDNWTAFTDGYRTWVNGPFGIQERLNSERFSWEGDAQSSSTAVQTVSSSESVTSSNGSATSTVRVSSTSSCTAVARSGSVSSRGLNSTTTIVGDGGTTVVNDHSTAVSSPGVTVTGC